MHSCDSQKEKKSNLWLQKLINNKLIWWTIAIEKLKCGEHYHVQLMKNTKLNEDWNCKSHCILIIEINTILRFESAGDM